MKKHIIMTILFAAAMSMIAGAAFAATSDTVTVSANVGMGTSMLSIAETAIDFGNVTPAQADHRFSAGPFTVTYFAATAPWTIRMSTDNHPGDDGDADDENAYAGLKGADGVSYIPLKLWNQNRGPLGAVTPPDPEDDANWNNADPALTRWSFIVEKDAQDPADPTSWCRLAWKNSELNSPFANYLAFDAEGTKNQLYNTTLTIELINQ